MQKRENEWNNVFAWASKIWALSRNETLSLRTNTARGNREGIRRVSLVKTNWVNRNYEWVDYQWFMPHGQGAWPGLASGHRGAPGPRPDLEGRPHIGHEPWTLITRLISEWLLHERLLIHLFCSRSSPRALAGCFQQLFFQNVSYDHSNYFASLL